MFSRGRSHALLVLTVGVLALGISACGDSDDEPSQSQGSNGGAAENGAAAAAEQNGDANGSASPEPGDASSPDSDPQSSGEGQTDEEAATDVVDGIYSAMAKADAKAICEVMSPQAKRQMLARLPDPKTGAGAGSERTCEEGMNTSLGKGTGDKIKAKTTKVKITGDSAIATVSFGRGSTGKIPLVKQNGQWLLAGPSGQ